MGDSLIASRYSILHVGKFYPPHAGGMETHLRDLAVRQTSAAAVRVVVANSVPRHEVSQIDGVHVDRVARYATVASMPVCPGLAAAIRRHPADIVHIHTPNPGAALAFLLSGHTGRLIVTHHADTLGRAFLRRLSDPYVHRVMRRAGRIIVTSSRYLHSSAELLPFRDKCRVIPLGIDLAAARAPEPAKTQQLRSQYGDRLILAIGRLVPYKGFDILIRAMRNVNARLVLIGQGPQQEALAQLAAQQGVSGRIAMPGRVDDLRPWLAAAALFVLPSVTRAEAFGMVQLEAMAAGLPVVNTDIASAVPEVSLHGNTGITVPPADPAALADAINFLLNRPDLRHSMGEAARLRATTEYSADRMAQRTLDLYAEVLADA